MYNSTMNAGRELDALIAEKVMGMKVLGNETCVYVEGDATVHIGTDPKGWSCFAEIGPVVAGEYCRCEEYKDDSEYKDFTWKYDHLEVCLKPVPNYSTSIADAWLVVEKLRSAQPSWHLIINDTSGPCYRARFYALYGVGKFDIDQWVRDPNDDFTVWAETAPLAICLAAPYAVGDKERTDETD